MKRYRSSSGELIIQFEKFDKQTGNPITKIVKIYFDSVDRMFKEFHREWKKAQDQDFFFYQLMRYCVDNNSYSNEEKAKSKIWFSQIREVCDQREGYVINRNNIFGIKILLDQYIFEKEGE